MTPRSARRLWWAGLALMLPLPMIFPAAGQVPAGRFLMLGGVTLAAMAAEGARGVAPVLAAVFLGQGVLYLAVLWVAAWGISRALGRLPARAVAAATIAALAAGAALAVGADVYHTPFAAAAARGNLVHVYR